jgi:DNA-binding NtrC family response regulator
VRAPSRTCPPAPTADAALAIAEHHPGPIDLLVSDVIMPGLSGPDLAQRVVRLRPSIKVLYVSGYPNRAIERPGPLNRSARFLCKPFAPHLLAATVRDCLDSATGGAEGRTQ